MRVTESSSTRHPAWYGHHYPSWDDLETFAWDLGVAVVLGPVSKGAYFVANLEPGSPAVIAIPQNYGPLARTWALAHELGHLVQHAGPKGEMFHRKDEAQANRWAGCALIPFARIQAYLNACEDSMVAALSAHYEDIPMRDCPARRLAGRIAKIRLHALSLEVA